MEKSKIIIIILAFGFTLFIVILGIILTPNPRETKIAEKKPPIPIAAKVLSVEPLEGQEGVSAAPDVRVVFTSPVNKNELSVESSSNVSFNLVDYKSRSNEAIFRPSEPLQSNKKYNLVIKVSDQPLFRWEFTSKKFVLKDKGLAGKINKIKEQIPKKTNNYLISYDAATDGFAVYVEKGNFSTERGKVDNWFKSFGISNLSVINISYIPRAGVRGDF